MEFDEKSSSGGVKVKTPRGEGESCSPQLLSSPPCLSPSTLPRRTQHGWWKRSQQIKPLLFPVKVQPVLPRRPRSLLSLITSLMS
ncbi:hypothetical protein MHYP_G00041300 [Metynnis hypsauchen]